MSALRGMLNSRSPGEASRVSETETIVRERVLVVVVDEDPWTVRSARGLLDEAGFRTLAFGSPLAALEILAPHRSAAVVVTENRMRELSGATLSTLARERLGGERPGFVLSTRSLAGVAPGERLLFDAWLEKPLERESLIAAVESAYRARGAVRPHAARRRRD